MLHVWTFKIILLTFWTSAIKRLDNKLFSWNVLNMNLSIFTCLLQQLYWLSKDEWNLTEHQWSHLYLSHESHLHRLKILWVCVRVHRVRYACDWEHDEHQNQTSEFKQVIMSSMLLISLTQINSVASSECWRLFQ